MEPVKLGRTLGIGMRVASGMLRDRAGRVGQKQAAPAPKPSAPINPPVVNSPGGPSNPSELGRTEHASGKQQPDLALLAQPSVSGASGISPRAAPADPKAAPARAGSFPAALGRRVGERMRAGRKGPGMFRGAARGCRGFASAFWGPFRHASGVLWLEISGMFFALFGLFFAQNVYEARSAWMGGAEHEHFLLYVALTLIFFWFSASSFLRAHRRSRKRQER